VELKNKGFTLIELLVVIVIIGIVTAIASYSVAALDSARAEKASASVNALISKCRAGCLARTGDVHLTIAFNSSGDIVCSYYENGVISETDIIDGDGISIVCTMKNTDNSLSTKALSESAVLTLSFDRSTGSQDALPDGSCCTAISFIGSRTHTIELVPSTGNHKLVKG
jgi:prepilin-type N-terminal cleavage/methylation domain-containing protein